MGTISEKITYLNETKNKIKDNINLTGVNITNEDTFRSYAGKLKQGLLDILNKGNDYLYNNFPQLNGEGQNISLMPTLEAPIKSELLGNTTQNGTPTPDAPVEVINATGEQVVKVVGKNLFNDYRTTERTFAGVTTSGVDGGVKLDGTYDRSTSADFWLTESTRTSYNNLILLKANTTYTVKLSVISGTFETNYGLQCNLSSRTADENKTFNYNYQALTQNDNIWSATFTTGDSDIYAAGIRFTLATNRITTFNNTVFHIQIEQGSTASEYEAYKEQNYEINLNNIELCEIDNYQDVIKKGTGKNLFSTEMEQGGWSFTTGNKFNSANYIRTKEKISVTPGETYTLSFIGPQPTGNASGYVFFNNDTYVSNLATSNLTFTVPSNANQVVYNLYGTSIIPTDASNIQIEAGTQTTSYEPYNSKNKWLLTKKIGKVVLDGSENWSYYSVTQGSLFRSNNVILDEIKNNTYVPYSKYYQGISYNNYQNIQNNQFYINSDNNFLDFIDNRYTNANDFKTWLSTHNTTVYYVLATPTVEEITDSTLLNDLNNLEDAKSYNGTTNIIITAETPADIKITALKNE